MFAAPARHPRLRSAIHQRVLHLVRDDADAVLGDDGEPSGVEIGQAEMPDPAFLF